MVPPPIGHSIGNNSIGNNSIGNNSNANNSIANTIGESAEASQNDL